MFFTGKTISRKFFGGLLLVAVVPIILMGYGIHTIARNILIHSAYVQIETTRDDHENHLNTWFGERVKDR